jgi:hypothetical protein
MAIFCETLAETAVVAEACEVANMGISGAYAARRRNPVFAAAWDAALTIARERLADTLLARSMEGNIEQIWRDGELVGERHVLDNRLGLAILRRLDRLAETGQSLHAPDKAPRPPSVRPAQSFDWMTAVAALRNGDDKGVAAALAISKSYEVEEVEDPSNQPPSPPEPATIDLSPRCWRDEMDQVWMTDFPPPEGFDGYESRDYDQVEDEEPYARACTAEEVAVLEAGRQAERDAERAEDAALRDAWFDYLRDELRGPAAPAPGDESGQSGVAGDKPTAVGALTFEDD